ncbi:ABC transporter substrate-binding protein [Clostridium cellulovorans]|uniref:NMT1/THI5 like domain protein n=1 Tax=Clostridium cellulovorans (strain ATCC 35296 / DSM 3052 / OCM 3 / 743B) TaxID=573061 RepID=D9SVW3_CLOC7|nr:ABC transporter substrate-binding protein [Clostridium cellulovorans]ADL53174.1 NMT1/THI5 like domain protein [Clostridium cellulovorans 743B]
MKKVIATILILATSTLALVGCGQKQESNVKKQGDTSSQKVVRLGSATTSNFLGELAGVAQDKKFIEEELEKKGYKVEYINFPAAGPAVNEAFVGGSIDVAHYGDLPPTVLRSKGQDVKILAITNNEYNMDLVVQPDSDIKFVEDIKGKKIIVGKGTIYQQYFGNIIKEHGVSEKDVEVLNVVAEAQSTFSSKNADGYVTSHVIAQKLVKEGLGRIVISSVDKPEYANQTVFVGKTAYIKENPDVPVAIIKALLRAKEFVIKNPEESYKIMAQAGYPVEAIKEAYSYDKGKFNFFTLDIDEGSVAKLKNLNKFLREQNLTAKDVNVDDFVDNSYYEKALEEFNKK